MSSPVLLERVTLQNRLPLVLESGRVLGRYSSPLLRLKSCVGALVDLGSEMMGSITF
jgi:hypothetical protein